MSNLSNQMQQQRRFVTGERSSQKDGNRATYEPLTQSTHSQTNIPADIPRYGSSAHLLVVPTSNRMKYSDLPRSPSASGLQTREQHLKGNIARRKNQGVVSNLKNELQNLKLEVSRIMNKDGDNNNTYSSRDSGVHSACEQYDTGDNIILGQYGKEISDSVSVTSQKVIDQPLRKLQLQYGSQNYDHTHYLQLENNLLKTELRNLKNKYNATKQQLRQRCDALEKKNQYLQISLRRSQQALRECKRNLQIEMQTIKFQLNRKMQQQVEEQKKIKQKMVFPERDLTGGNQLMQDKLKKLYQQLNDKSRTINNMNLQFNDTRAQLEKKSFQLKKQLELNRQLSKQLQFAKRQNARNQVLLDQQVVKKMDLTKTVQMLKQKMNDLSKQVHLKDRIVNNSQQYENRVSAEIQNYKLNEQKLANENFELQQQIRKLRQFSATNQQEIRHLKMTIKDFTTQIQQLSKNLKLEKEKNMEIQQNYRKMIDEIKHNDQLQLQQVQKQFDRYRQMSTETNFEKEESLKERVDTDIRQKDRQISKWKAEYKMLKIKYEENITLENSKREQIETYYRSYKEYKSKNKVLQMRNKVLQDSANELIEKIQKIQASNLQERAQFLQNINNLNMHCQQLARRAEFLQMELHETREALNNQGERANVQQGIRKQIQQKVLTLDIDGNNGLMQIIEKIKKRVNDQDQKVNKYIKQIKTKDTLIAKLRQQIRDVMQGQQKEFENFKIKQIQGIVQQIQSKTIVSLDELRGQFIKQIEVQVANNNELIAQNTQFKGEISQLTKQLMDLRQQAKSISHLYNIKSSQGQQTRDKHKAELQAQEQKFEEMQKILSGQIKALQQQLGNKNEQLAMHRNQVKMLNTAIINMNKETFDQALKNQIEASKKLRQQINRKNEQVYRVRDSHAQLKAQYDNLKSENDINKLKFISQKKNIQVQYEVESQQLKNLLLVQQKKVSSLEQKIKLVIDQNKKKDNFIQTYIMGKKLPNNERQFVAAFLKQYEINVTGKNISEKLQSESQQLEKLTLYNFGLMKQIAELKEKLLLYEVKSVDAVSHSEMKESIADEEGFKRLMHKGNMPIDKEDLRR